jgi:hypothetical protein
MSIDFKNWPGHHGPSSPIVGTRRHDLSKIREQFNSESILKELEEVLYYGERSPSFIHLIPSEQKDKADGMRAGAFFDLH